MDTWCPSIQYMVYTGSQEERRSLRAELMDKTMKKNLNVLITTYALVSSTNEDKAFIKRNKFDYVIFDEAHMLRNMSTIRYQSLIKINVKEHKENFLNILTFI